MKVITRPTVAALLVLTLFTASAFAQQKRPAPAKPQPKPAAAPVPAPTFDTLIPADSYTIYGEVRGVGQLIQSGTINEALEPIIKLAGPPKEFRTVVKWLKAHADELMASRMLLVTSSVNKALPDVIIALEFESAEEAAKFATPFNTMLKGVIPPETDSSPETQGKTPAVPKPGYYLQQAGSLILITPTPLNLKNLKPAGSKPLTEDINFRAARSRFSSEPIFVFFNVKLTERQEEERRKQSEKQRQETTKQVREQAEAAAEEAKKSEEEAEPEQPDNDTVTEQRREVVGVLADGTGKDAAMPDPVMMALTTLGASFFEGQSKWPDGIAFALTLENDSIDVRALFVNEAGEKSDTVPFMPALIPGPPVVFEAPNVLPADTEILVTMSLDLQQMYTLMASRRPNSMTYLSAGKRVEEVSIEPPFAAIEKQLKMNLKNDVLPLLGSEIAVKLPSTGVGMVGPFPTMISGVGGASSSPVMLISLRDRDGVRALMPKIVDALGFKGASALAQTERKEDTELVSYLNALSYAFVGNFLVVSSDAGSVRHVVESYLKHETLSGDANFKNFTRWQPRPAHGQVYISSSLMDGFKAGTATDPNKPNPDPAKMYLAQLASSPSQPITYALSNEGLGPLHELHVPKNLLLMAIAGFSGGFNPSPERQSEGSAMGLMMMIAQAQEDYKKTSGSYGTMDQLIEAKHLSKEFFENTGYKFEIFVSGGDRFEAQAVPVEYGKNGKMSFFVDQTRILRGADHNGASANAADPPVWQ
jgi:hypothetical protein